MKKIFLILVLQSMVFALNAQTPKCLDFADGSMHGWTVNVDHTYPHPGVTATIQPNGGPHGSGDAYLHGSDMSGQSFMYNVTDYSGDWTVFFNAPCPNFCWDFKIFDDGNSSGTNLITPSIVIFKGYNSGSNWGPGNPTYYAVFVCSTTPQVTDDNGGNPGWHHYCAPIAPCSGTTMPANSDGHWLIYNNTGSSPVLGTCADWMNLLSSVQGVKIGFDYTSSPSEQIGFDQLCLADCGGHTDDMCCSNFIKHINSSIHDSGGNVSLSASFSAGPRKIKKITADIIDFSMAYNDHSASGPYQGSICAPCVSNSDLWGNFKVSDPNAISVDGLPGRPSVPAGSSSIYSREVIWGSTYGPGVNMSAMSPAISIPITLPPKNPSSCCSDTVRLCIRYKFTDTTCVTCDTVICYSIVRGPSGIHLGTGGLPSLPNTPAVPAKKEDTHFDRPNLNKTNKR